MTREWPPWKWVQDYCQSCGSPNVEAQRLSGDFDGLTGLRNVEGRLRCPRKRWPLDAHYDSGWVRLSYLPPPPEERD